MYLSTMQDREDPNCIRQLFETNMFLRTWDRAQLMKRACDLFAEAGLNKEATQSHWDRMLFLHSRRDLAEEATGRFGTGYFLGLEFPHSAFFTEDVLDYYERRAHETANPTLKSWYADFIWERRHKYEFALMAIRALHDAYPLFVKNAAEWIPVAHPAVELLSNEEAEILKTTWWNHAADAVVRSLRLARKLNKPDLVEEAKVRLFEALEDFQTHDRESHNRIILGSVEALLEGKDVTREELVAARQVAEQGEQFFLDRGSLGGAKTLADLESRVAKKMGDLSGAKEALLRVGRYLEIRAEDTDSMSHAIGLQQALEHYASIGSGSDVERLKKETPHAWASAHESGAFKTMEISQELPLDELRINARKMLATGLDDALVQLARAPEFVPSASQVREMARELGDKYPLTRLVNSIQLEGTRQILSAQTPEQSEEAAIRQQYNIQVGILGMFLDVSFGVFREEGQLSTDAFVRVIRHVSFIQDDQVAMIESGLERYFAGDYISAIHILVPQLEDVLRRTVGYLGGTTTYRSDTTTEKDLGQILDSPEMARLFGSDVVYLLKHTFTELLGLNLRNRVGHGLIRPEDCTSTNCALVIHSLLRLAACEELHTKDEDSEDPAS